MNGTHDHVPLHLFIAGEWIAAGKRATVPVVDPATEKTIGAVPITFGITWAETPFGGVKESGYGSEGGSEGLDAYLTTRFIGEA